MDVAPGFELQAWIKGFLPHVEVLAPLSLRDKIAQDVEAAHQRAKGRAARAR
jgi:predicted DNA-binding transcriptional regulator YafY